MHRLDRGGTVSLAGVDPEITHLEELLDLFRKIDALTHSAVGLREQVDQQSAARPGP